MISLSFDNFIGFSSHLVHGIISIINMENRKKYDYFLEGERGVFDFFCCFLIASDSLFIAFSICFR